MPSSSRSQQPEASIEQRITALFDANLRANQIHTDRLFAVLMIIQWLAAVAVALLVSPRTWIGSSSNIHAHVYTATGLGLVLISFPLFLVYFYPGRVLTRHTIAVAQMLMGAWQPP